MARKRARPRAAVRKAMARSLEAARATSQPQIIGDGVRAVAADIEGREMALPLYLTAPLIYACEMAAVSVCKRYEWKDPERADQVSRYLFAGLQEVSVAALTGFDAGNFEEWIAAQDLQASREGVSSG